MLYPVHCGVVNEAYSWDSVTLQLGWHLCHLLQCLALGWPLKPSKLQIPLLLRFGDPHFSSILNDIFLVQGLEITALAVISFSKGYNHKLFATLVYFQLGLCIYGGQFHFQSFIFELSKTTRNFHTWTMLLWLPKELLTFCTFPEFSHHACSLLRLQEVVRGSSTFMYYRAQNKSCSM